MKRALRFLVMAVSIAIISSSRSAIAASRAEVLARLLGSTGVTVDWQDKALATSESPTPGAGLVVDQAFAVLQGTNFIVSYAPQDNGIAIDRIIVFGRSDAPVLAPSAPLLRRPNGSPKMAQPANISAISHLKATNDAIRVRLEQLPPGQHVLRTQAIRLGALRNGSTRGNVPLLATAITLPP